MIQAIALKAEDFSAYFLLAPDVRIVSSYTDLEMDNNQNGKNEATLLFFFQHNQYKKLLDEYAKIIETDSQNEQSSNKYESTFIIKYKTNVIGSFILIIKNITTFSDVQLLQDKQSNRINFNMGFSVIKKTNNENNNVKLLLKVNFVIGYEKLQDICIEIPR